MLFVRYMRLTPAYAVVLFFHVELQPFLGNLFSHSPLSHSSSSLLTDGAATQAADRITM